MGIQVSTACAFGQRSGKFNCGSTNLDSWLTYTEIDFNSRSDDDRLAVCICCEVFDGEDADNLNDSNEETKGKHSDEAEVYCISPT